MTIRVERSNLSVALQYLGWKLKDCIIRDVDEEWIEVTYV